MAKIESWHWGLVIYNQIVTCTAFAILAMFCLYWTVCTKFQKFQRKISEVCANLQNNWWSRWSRKMSPLRLSKLFPINPHYEQRFLCSLWVWICLLSLVPQYSWYICWLTCPLICHYIVCTLLITSLVQLIFKCR